MQGKKIRWQVLLVIILFLFSGCQAWEDRLTVAKVNGEVIKKKPYRLIYQARYQGLIQAHTQAAASMEQQLAKQVIEEMVNDLLLFQEAKRRNMVPSTEEVNKIMGHPKEGETAAATFTKALKEKGITMEELREEMQRRMAVGKLRNELTKGIEVTEQEAKSYYDKNKALFYIPAQYQIRMLFAPDPAQAEAYLKQINSGAARFEDLVQKNPTHFAQRTGAEPTWVTAEDFSPDMGKVLMETKKGKVGGPVRGMDGFFLIKLYAKKDRRPESFKEAKDKILRNLGNEKKEAVINKWLAEQKQKSTIEIKESRLAVKMERKTAAKTATPPSPPATKAGGGKG